MAVGSANIDTADLALEQIDDDDGYLLGGCYIGGTLVHFDAIRVINHPEHGQIATRDDEQGGGRLTWAFEYDPDGPFQTVEIPGHEGEYVLIATAGKQ